MENPEIELICTVYNINYGKNREPLEKCTFLREYMIFIDYVRDNRANGYDNLEYSIEAAIDRCIEGNVLREFLTKRRAKVVKILPFISKICLAYTKIICYYHLKADNHLQADVLYEQSRF